jgi:hypothetical protein
VDKPWNRVNLCCDTRSIRLIATHATHTVGDTET